MKAICASLVALFLLPLTTAQEIKLSQDQPTPNPKAVDAGFAGQKILTAKTLCVMGAWGEWERPGTYGTIVTVVGTVSEAVSEGNYRIGESMPGGQRPYEADPPLAKKKVEDAIRKWRRFGIADDPAKADLVLLVVVRHHSKYGVTTVSNELLVFPAGAVPDQSTPILWQSGDTKAMVGFAATKVTKKFQEYVQNLEKKTQR